MFSHFVTVNIRTAKDLMKCVATIDQSHFSVDSDDDSDIENSWLIFFSVRWYAILTSQYDSMSVT